ncbi:MAG: hypothetical protein JWM43_3764 [Acidobacteriaceae bacterium]|nr:hypothetical protein [Acidobacteriaceae bacterium]
MHKGFSKSILWGGIAAGTLSLSAALIVGRIQGTRSLIVLQSIASGLLSDIAFMGGSFTAALGAVLHFVIAFGVPTVCCVLACKLSFVNKLFFIVGPIYGIVVCLVMKMIILPLSGFPTVMLQSPHSAFLGLNLAVGFLIHIFFVGYPVALAAAHFSGDSIIESKACFGAKDL